MCIFPGTTKDPRDHTRGGHRVAEAIIRETAALLRDNRGFDAAQTTQPQTPSAGTRRASAPAVAAATRRQHRAPGRRVVALDARDRIPAACAACALARQGARLSGAGADGPPGRRVAAAVADLVGAVVGSRRFSAMEAFAGIH